MANEVLPGELPVIPRQKINAQFALKAPIADPTFTGVVTAPEIRITDTPTINNGFVHRSVFRISGVTSWATQMVLTPSGAGNGFGGCIKATLAGHTSGIGDGGIEALWSIDAADTPAQESLLEFAGSPPQFRITASADVQTLQIQSSNGVAEFRGVLELEVYIPRDFAASGGTTWTIT